MHAVLLIYTGFKKTPQASLRGLLAGYLVAALLWDVSVFLQGQPAFRAEFPLIYVYTLLPMVVFAWTYTDAFLHLGRTRWKILAVVGASGILMALIQFVPYPLPYIPIPFTGRYLDKLTMIFWLGIVISGLTIGHALWLIDHTQTTLLSPRHQNRARLLNIALAMIVIGLTLALITPTTELGLVVHWMGAITLTFITYNRYLPDIKYSLKELLGWFMVTLLNAAFFFLLVYSLQHSFGGPSLVWAISVSLALALLFPVFYSSIQVSIQRTLFAHQYNSAKIIKSYVHAINNLLLLQDLVSVSLTFIAGNLNIARGAYFLVDKKTDTTIRFAIHSNLNGDLPASIELKKDTPITEILIDRGAPLAQFTLDLDPEFHQSDPEGVAKLHAMGFEQYFPIERNGTLVGILALGAFSSGRDYAMQDIDLLSTIAEQSAIALENAQLFEDVRHNLQEITRINSMMDNIFASIQSGVITIDVQDRIIVINDAAHRILNLADPVPIGTPIETILKTLPHTPIPALLRDVKTTFRQYKGYELTQEVPGRGAVNLSVDITPIRNAQKAAIGVALVLNDLTETRKLRAVQNLFRKYLSPAVVDRLPNDPAELKLGGKRQEVTVLFADIRGFSTFSEDKNPEDLITVLNKYLSLAAEAILAYEGTLDKFVGDAVMAIFNAPLPQPDHTLRAVRAALEMQRAIDRYHQMMAEYAPHLTFGVGIHVGEAVIGNVGTQSRMDYTAIGDAVNLAKRLQENTPGGRILLSAAAYERVKDFVDASPYETLTVKGRQTPEQTYELHKIL